MKVAENNGDLPESYSFVSADKPNAVITADHLIGKRVPVIPEKNVPGFKHKLIN
ncbi:MAG: hypothetical protein ACI3XQ_06625 [Eubacteriales bacterium]